MTDLYPLTIQQQMDNYAQQLTAAIASIRRSLSYIQKNQNDQNSTAASLKSSQAELLVAQNEIKTAQQELSQGDIGLLVSQMSTAQADIVTISGNVATAQNAADAAATAASTAQTEASAAQTTADSAVSDASTAQATADASSTAAANAQTTADSAVTAATNAQAAADAANTAAVAAQSTADSANTAAAAAQSTADTAVTAASTAQATADTANTAAANASTDASTAVTNASTALTTANAAQTTANNNTTTINTITLNQRPIVYGWYGGSVNATASFSNFPIGNGGWDVNSDTSVFERVSDMDFHLLADGSYKIKIRGFNNMGTTQYFSFRLIDTTNNLVKDSVITLDTPYSRNVEATLIANALVGSPTNVMNLQVKSDSGSGQFGSNGDPALAIVVIMEFLG